LGYQDFDTGLEGEGFPDRHASCSMSTLQNATCSEQLDPMTGKTCPGALQLSIDFQAYASGTAEDEIAHGALDFSFADWSQAAAFHVMVKVSPVNAPIIGVHLYLQSGDDYAYDAIFDATDYKSGTWHEMVFPLSGAILNLTEVRRWGVQVILNRAGNPGNPAQPPHIEVLFDDVWLEPK
jgi:hypothetical protein